MVIFFKLCVIVGNYKYRTNQTYANMVAISLFRKNNLNF